MPCPTCGAEASEQQKFCHRCGSPMIVVCPDCRRPAAPDHKFCGHCGSDLTKASALAAKPLPSPRAEQERKYVTVVFSDLSGYTAMTERLDPEEVREIMDSIFGKISQVVVKYEGFIEKFVGDAVMAIFGVPKSHEDDPVRAIRASREIHDLVNDMSPALQQRTGLSLRMHTGINTGLVVARDIDLAKGTHGVLGDTINTAARLSGVAQTDEIVVGLETHHQSEGYFHFEVLDAVRLKGKAEPVKLYKVVSPRETPTKTHRLSGLRADLVGRGAEMAQLTEALEALSQGKSSIISIIGDAGTGKSRLVEELKGSLDAEAFQWREGHAYAFTQNIPYFPFTDLLNQAWQIREGDRPELVKQKLEAGATAIIGERPDLIPYLGSLYSLTYPEIADVSPESWRARLHEAIQLVLANLCKHRTTIICIEDLHWADPSSVSLLRSILLDLEHPVLFICLYRPSFRLFTSQQTPGIHSCHEIRLHDLSSAESQDMVQSLLHAADVPADLRRFIQSRVEGNPFYLEEVINSLIETETLVCDHGAWRLTRPLTEKDIPGTVQGIVSARLDRLERETKLILQEASVIGRAFLYKILQRISALQTDIDRSLDDLERLDLIRTRSVQPDLEYIFKHALTQEVVYNGLLRKERQQIHERIGRIVEELFRDRLHEFYETLAYHFKKGHSLEKAVEYLMKAGGKSTNRYSLEEANLYYQEAFDLVSSKPDRSMPEQELLIDILNNWSLVKYYGGSYEDLKDLLLRHQDVAEVIHDKAKSGVFFAWVGITLFEMELYADAYSYLQRALVIGEERNDQRILAYACTYLTWTGAELGRLTEAAAYGIRARDLSNRSPADHMIFSQSRGGIAHLNFYKGIGAPNFELGRELFEHERRFSDARALAVGHICHGYGHLTKGDFSAAIESVKAAIAISVDPAYRQWALSLLGMCYLETLQVEEAEAAINEVISFGDKFGFKQSSTAGRAFLGPILILKGKLARGLEVMEEVRGLCEENERRFGVAMTDCNLGQVYAQLAIGGQGVTFSMVVKNLGFLVKNLPFAARKAEAYFLSAIRQFHELGSPGWVGRASLELGRLHKAKGRKEQARRYVADAIQLFAECEADVFLEQAQQELAAL
jgi:class 3 adenylate cyclase/tetratricopeptide (TPR) repeat protein